MRILFKTIIIFFLAGAIFSLPTWYYWYIPKFRLVAPLSPKPIMKSYGESVRLKAETSTLKKYLTTHNFNSTICFLVDMKIASGKNRFFVYDLKKDSILFSALVAHGSCDNGFQIQARFSNQINSGCSSIGKFRIGNSYNGRFGLAYKLYGLDSSNSNAYERALVLHSYECIPEQEIYPLPVCNSRGCPMVSSTVLQKLKSYLQLSNKPVLLNIFYGVR